VDTSTPTGKMVFTVLVAVAEPERSLIAERVRAGVRNARAKGDLNGFTITGGGPSGAFAGVDVGNRTGVTIKNGTIQNFRVGVFGGAPLKLTVSDLILKNNTPNGGVVIFDGGEDLVIRNSTFLLPPVSSCNDGTIAITLIAGTKVDVNNIDVHGGLSGVNISCSLCDGSETPPTGKIRNSTFTGTHVGVDVNNTTDLTISNNHFSNIVQTEACGFGFAIISGRAGAALRTGIKVRNNFIHDNFEGITMNGMVAGVEIVGNQIRDNSNFGIGLRESAGLLSTGNVIKNNITSGNGVDLLHDVPSSPNTWKNNSCVTKVGADIPAC